MRPLGILFVSVILLRAQESPPPTPGKDKEQANEKELGRLRGAWELVSEVISGQTQTARGSLLVHQKNAGVLAMGHGVIDATIAINAKANPKSWDFRFTDGKNDQVLKCIYQLDGETLQLCWREGGKVRPSAFPGKKGSEGDCLLFVFKRKKL